MAALQHTFGRIQSHTFTSTPFKTLIKPQKIPKHLNSSQSRTLTQPSALPLQSLVAAVHPVLAAVEIDWSDPDVQIGALGAFLGLALGIGTPIFYISRERRDEERLEELRALNRATKQETGEYLSDEEIEAIRPPRWTDRREFVDDD